MKAVCNNQVLAESDDTVAVDCNHYLPAESLNREFIDESSTMTVCGWKCTANYFTLKVSSEMNPDVVWYDTDPESEAEQIRGRVPFWKCVTA